MRDINGKKEEKEEKDYAAGREKEEEEERAGEEEVEAEEDEEGKEREEEEGGGEEAPWAKAAPCPTSPPYSFRRRRSRPCVSVWCGGRQLWCQEGRAGWGRSERSN